MPELQKKMLQPASTPSSNLPTSRIIQMVSYTDSPHSRLSLTPLQKTSQALLVESFTCSLKDLRSGALTAGVWAMLHAFNTCILPVKQKPASVESFQHVLHQVSTESVWLQRSAEWGRRRRKSRPWRRGDDTWCKKSACNLWNTPVVSPLYTTVLTKWSVCVCWRVFMWMNKPFWYVSVYLPVRGNERCSGVRVRIVFPLCLCGKLKDLAGLRGGNDI